MIEINLLPPEMRKVDRTSLKKLLAAVSAAVLLSASGLGITMSVSSYRAECAENVAATGEVARVEVVAKEYDVLSSEVKAIETRIQTIDEIRTTRMRWGRKLDQLYAILPEYVWFDKLELKAVRSGAVGQAAPAQTLLMQCYVAGPDERKYAELRRVITGEVVGEGPYAGGDFYRDFASLGYSGWSREDFGGTEEGVALKFDLELQLKPLVQTAPAKPAVRPVVAAK